jgi:O-antigen/teichoic acid export membrane protein
MASFMSAKTLTTLSVILLGRILGEEGMGHSLLIVAGGLTLAAFLSMGLPPTINVYIPKSRSAGRAELSVSLIVTLVLFLLFLAILPYTELTVASILGLNSNEFLLAIAIGTFSNAYNLATAALQGLQLARARAYCEFVMSVTTTALALGLAYLGGWGIWALPFSMAAGTAIGLIPALPHLVSRVSLSDIPSVPIRTMTVYSLFALLCTIGGLFGSSIQRIQIERLLTQADLGIFGMQSQASIGIAHTLSGAIGAILIAKAAARLDKPHLIWHIMKVWAYLAPAVIATFVIAQYLAMMLAGFPINIGLAVGFAVAGYLIMVHTSISNVMAGHGLWGSIVGVLFSALHAGTIWVLTERLAPIYGVTGGAMALNGGYLVIIGIALASLPWFFRLPDYSISPREDAEPRPPAT